MSAERTLSERFHAGDRPEPFLSFAPITRQMWACRTCQNRRQWGTCRFETALGASLDAGEVIAINPFLWCVACGAHQQHVHSHDEGRYE